MPHEGSGLRVSEDLGLDPALGLGLGLRLDPALGLGLEVRVRVKG